MRRRAIAHSRSAQYLLAMSVMMLGLTLIAARPSGDAKFVVIAWWAIGGFTTVVAGVAACARSVRPMAFAAIGVYTGLRSVAYLMALAAGAEPWWVNLGFAIAFLGLSIAQRVVSGWADPSETASIIERQQ